MYRLSAGDVVRGPLIGLDTATYRSTSQYVASATQLLDARAGRIATLERARLLADSTTQAQAAELRRCRGEVVASAKDYEHMRSAARAVLAQQPRPPLLLDSHFYKGVATGGVLAGAIRLGIKLIFHI